MEVGGKSGTWPCLIIINFIIVLIFNTPPDAFSLKTTGVFSGRNLILEEVQAQAASRRITFPHL